MQAASQPVLPFNAWDHANLGTPACHCATGPHLCHLLKREGENGRDIIGLYLPWLALIPSISCCLAAHLSISSSLYCWHFNKHILLYYGRHMCLPPAAATCLLPPTPCLAYGCTTCCSAAFLLAAGRATRARTRSPATNNGALTWLRLARRIYGVICRRGRHFRGDVAAAL